MRDDISPAAERALDSAERDARKLFLALIADEEGRAAMVLTDAGAELEKIRRHLVTLPPTPLDLPAVLSAARDAAGERAETTLTGEFLLLGLLRSATALAEPLRAAGVPLDRLGTTAELPPLPMDFTLEPVDPPDFTGAVRIVDVNANRAREALRVIDDHCRFILDDRTLTEHVKAMRHWLAEVMDAIPLGVMTEARDTDGDVGTTVTVAGELHRGSPHEVARVNFKRLQEALRSLEEHGKIVAPGIAPRVEAIRYRAYTLEKAVVAAADTNLRLHALPLCVLLTGSACAASMEWTIAEAAAGGASFFQLREKTLSDNDLLIRARDVRRWTKEVGAMLVINDRPDIARLCDADGVHLGQDDMAVRDARRILGPGKLIGVSTHNADQVRQAVMDGASYLGVGPTFASSTKTFDGLAGLDFVREAAALTTLPSFVIGGVTPENVGEVFAAGGRRVAVSAAVCGADDPQTVVRRLIAALVP